MCLQLIGFKLFLATIFEKNTIPEFEKANKLRQYIIMLKIAPFLISMPNAVIIAIFTHENFVCEFIMNTSENWRIWSGRLPATMAHQGLSEFFQAVWIKPLKLFHGRHFESSRTIFFCLEVYLSVETLRNDGIMQTFPETVGEKNQTKITQQGARWAVLFTNRALSQFRWRVGTSNPWWSVVARAI